MISSRNTAADYYSCFGFLQLKVYMQYARLYRSVYINPFINQSSQLKIFYSLNYSLLYRFWVYRVRYTIFGIYNPL